MINIGICDDNKSQREDIIKICSLYEKENKVEFSYMEFSSGELLLACTDEIDILFLDVELTGINGIQVMKEAENRNNIHKILFVSSHEKYVYDGYGSKSRGFISKPVDVFKVKNCLDKVLEELNKTKILEFETDRQKLLLKAEEVLLLTTAGNYVRLVCFNGEEHIIYGNMKNWNDKLSDYGIIRVHRSFMVNLRYIKKWGRTLTIKNDNIENEIEIPVGRQYYSDGKEAYEDFILKNMREL